jgi:endonuclease YncB( thermonuclease family)
MVGADHVGEPVKALAGFVVLGLLALAIVVLVPGPDGGDGARSALARPAAPEPGVDLPRPGLLARFPEPEPPARQEIVTPSVPARPPEAPASRRVAQAEPASSPEIVDRRVRNVTPPGMMPGPVVDGPLVRIPVPPPPPLQPRWQRFHRVVALDAGTLDLGRRKVRLAGIVAPDVGKTCSGNVNPDAPALAAVAGHNIPPGGLADIVPGGLGPPLLDIAVIDDAPAPADAAPSSEAAPIPVAAPAPAEADPASWPCGRAALTAFRMMLRSRAVECFFAADVTDDPVVAPCRTGDTDLSEWLVRQGWAENAPNNADFAGTETAARCALRGMWRAEEPQGCGR